MLKRSGSLTGLFSKKKRLSQANIMITKGGRTTLDESFNRLKDNVLFFGASGKKVIQVEASISGEGKTTVVCNLGVSLSHNDKKVVIVDLDFRSPGVGKIFGLEESIGISEFVLEEKTLDDVIKKTSQGVDVVTCGKEIYNSSYVLNSPKMSELINSLKERYEFVLLDCPPVLLMSDYMHIANYSDGILYTVSANFVKRSAVRDSLDLISKLNVPVIGSVMTYVSSDSVYYGYGKKR